MIDEILLARYHLRTSTCSVFCASPVAGSHTSCNNIVLQNRLRRRQVIGGSASWGAPAHAWGVEGRLHHDQHTAASCRAFVAVASWAPGVGVRRSLSTEACVVHCPLSLLVGEFVDFLCSMRQRQEAGDGAMVLLCCASASCLGLVRARWCWVTRGGRNRNNLAAIRIRRVQGPGPSVRTESESESESSGLREDHGDASSLAGGE